MSQHTGARGREVASGSEKAAAYFLWVVIALALTYGVAQTVIKVAALFTG